MYDIRFASENLQHKPKPMSRSHISSRPYLSFRDFSPEEIPDFDVSTELGLLACGKISPLSFALMFPFSNCFHSLASDDRKVRFFSLNTGKPVRSPLLRSPYTRPITGLCFEATGEMSPLGPQTPSLLVCSQAAVDQWVW